MYYVCKVTCLLNCHLTKIKNNKIKIKNFWMGGCIKFFFCKASEFTSDTNDTDK